MRKPLLIMLLAIIVLISGQALAQRTPHLSALTVRLWPEYDQPTMLVLYDITLAPDVGLPTSLTFRIPASAGELYGYGYYPDSDNQLPIKEGFSSQTEGDWLLVTFTVRTANAHLEYYDPSLAKQAGNRHFEFTWPGDYDVDSLTIIAQQPKNATYLSLSPGEASQANGTDGLTYYSVSAGAMAAGQSYAVVLDYQNPTGGLTITNMQVKPIAPLPQDNLMDRLPWIVAGILGTLGIVLVVGVFVWYWRSGRKAIGRTQASTSRSRRRSVEITDGEALPSSEESVYCHQCGRRSSPGDRFCRSCGAELRVT